MSLNKRNIQEEKEEQTEMNERMCEGNKSTKKAQKRQKSTPKQIAEIDVTTQDKLLEN